MTHPWVDLSVIVSENRRVTHAGRPGSTGAGTGQNKTRPVTTLRLAFGS